MTNSLEELWKQLKELGDTEGFDNEKFEKTWEDFNRKRRLRRRGPLPGPQSNGILKHDEDEDSFPPAGGNDPDPDEV